MRVEGNTNPARISITPYSLRDPNLVEVRVTENAEQAGDNLWAYDEYIFKMNNRDGLYSEVDYHFEDWIETGRALEVQSGASSVYHMEQEQLQEIAELVNMIYEDDLGVIG